MSFVERRTTVCRTSHDRVSDVARPYVGRQKMILFVSDSFDWVEHSRFLSRVPTEEHSGESTDSERYEDGPWLDVDRPASNEFHGITGAYSEDDSDDTPP